MNQEEIEYIKAYIDKPESEEFYIRAFEAYTKGGIDQFKWVWSWWAFAGGIFFLLYRKLYIEALVVFLVMSLAVTVPVVSMIIWIVTGALFPYLVFQRYKKGREMVANMPKDQALMTLREFGGFNQWAIYLAVAVNILFLIYFVKFAYMITLMGAM